jgi:hypothetical protein
MSNRIATITIRDRSLAPASAEAWITVLPQCRDGSTEIRGRLTGPHSAFAATVEVAYPLGPLGPSARGREPREGITVRLVVPEASLWTPQTPFLYEGLVELWQDGTCCDRVLVRHGFRSLTLGAAGLRLNGRPLTVRGRESSDLGEGALRALHEQRQNLVVVGPEEVGPATWDRADRLGILVVARLSADGERAMAQAHQLSTHCCALGCLIAVDAPWRDRLPLGLLVGTELDVPPVAPLPDGFQFVAGPSELASLGRPLLLRGAAPIHSPGITLIGSFRSPSADH